MVKSPDGFTLMEVLIGLAVLGVLASMAMPSMNTALNKHALKVQVTRLDTYIDQARNLAAITECPVQLALQSNGGDVAVNVQVELDPFLKGCSAWYAQSSDPAQRGFSGTLKNIALNNSINFRFDAVSGVLGSQNQTPLTLKYKNQYVEISYLGIGNGVAIYAQ